MRPPSESHDGSPMRQMAVGLTHPRAVISLERRHFPRGNRHPRKCNPLETAIERVRVESFDHRLGFCLVRIFQGDYSSISKAPSSEFTSLVPGCFQRVNGSEIDADRASQWIEPCGGTACTTARSPASSDRRIAGSTPFGIASFGMIKRSSRGAHAPKRAQDARSK